MPHHQCYGQTQHDHVQQVGLLSPCRICLASHPVGLFQAPVPTKAASSTQPPLLPHKLPCLVSSNPCSLRAATKAKRPRHTCIGLICEGGGHASAGAAVEGGGERQGAAGCARGLLAHCWEHQAHPTKVKVSSVPSAVQSTQYSTGMRGVGAPGAFCTGDRGRAVHR